MKLFDISLSLSSRTIVWPDDSPVRIESAADMRKGDECNLSNFSMSAHLGTHIDAPLHFIKNGKSVESIGIDILCGNATVVHIPGKKIIGSRELEMAGINIGTVRLIIKTDNSSEENIARIDFNADYSALDRSGAEWIVSRGIRLAGIDYLSIARFENPADVHKVLLSKEIVILEGLRLAGIEPGEYELYCLPLPIVGIDGAPARTILVRRE
jgi:arylformamidase